MTKFITLNMFLVQSGRSRSGPVLEEAVPFLEWKVGFTVKHKNNNESWRISTIEDNGGSTDMTYNSTVTLTNGDEAETKTLRGSTLQSSYAFVSGDVVTQKKLTTKEMTLDVDSISRFYARKNNQPGTRIIFKDKTAYIFDNPFSEVKNLVTGTPAQFAASTHDAPNVVEMDSSEIHDPG